MPLHKVTTVTSQMGVKHIKTNPPTTTFRKPLKAKKPSMKGTGKRGK